MLRAYALLGTSQGGSPKEQEGLRIKPTPLHFSTSTFLRTRARTEHGNRFTLLHKCASSPERNAAPGLHSYTRKREGLTPLNTQARRFCAPKTSFFLAPQAIFFASLCVFGCFWKVRKVLCTHAHTRFLTNLPLRAKFRYMHLHTHLVRLIVQTTLRAFALLGKILTYFVSLCILA